MAWQVSQAVARKLAYSLAGAGGSLRMFGPAFADAKANRCNKQEFHNASRDVRSKQNAEAPKSRRDQSDATPGILSFDPSAASPISGAEIDQPIARQRGESHSTHGVYKIMKYAILLGEVREAPIRRSIKYRRVITLFYVGTGGMRRQVDEKTPEEFAARSTVQWHKVAVYDEKLGNTIMRLMKPGSQVYLKGNLETRTYIDSHSQECRQIREIAVRSNGRLLCMDAASTAPTESIEPVTRPFSP